MAAAEKAVLQAGAYGVLAQVGGGRSKPRKCSQNTLEPDIRLVRLVIL